MLEAHAQLKADIARLGQMHVEILMLHLDTNITQGRSLKLQHQTCKMHEETEKQRAEMEEMSEKTADMLTRAQAALQAVRLTRKSPIGLTKTLMAYNAILLSRLRGVSPAMCATASGWLHIQFTPATSGRIEQRQITWWKECAHQGSCDDVAQPAYGLRLSVHGAGAP